MELRMKHYGTVCVALLSVWAGAEIARAQTIAFPGAEGAGKFTSGGRGSMATPGDVYIVTNLDDYDPDDDNNGGSTPSPYDSIEPAVPGSLRYGILTAPTAGRTIIFGISGTIDLHDRLDFKGHNNISIFGQTAPGGGITIAKHELDVDSDNIIIQHMRFRPGDRFFANHQQEYWPYYDADAIGVNEATNVMIDHVNASWGVDETISVTHNSNNVTVQWSTITQGLYDGGHSEGDGHSYGSLINGGAYTYYANLYAHSKSRNPRPQSSGNYLSLDFVNNVNFNHQDRMGYSDGNDPYDLNWVGNYGIKGPDSSSNNYMMRPDDTASHIYTEGNRMDIIRDGFRNGAAVDEATVFDPGDSYTLFASRLSPAELPLVNTLSANGAYIQVLSRAGAVNYRDPVDRQLIRSVMNQTDLSIDTQAEMGGWPTLPGGSPATDSNSDGVPDTWAQAYYGDTSTQLNTVFDGGYSYLEKYVHSLTPYAYLPAGTQSVTISTGYGQGADAQINENGGGSATSAGIGDGTELNALWSGTSGNNNQMIVLKFDLSQIEPGSVTDAALELTASETISGTHTFRVFGLEHDATGWDWDDGTIDFETLAGVTFDGNSHTLGINPNYTADGEEAGQDNPALDVPDLLRLGEFSADSLSAGQTATLDDLNLAVFLNLAAYFEGEDQEGLVTLILEQINDSSTNDASFYSAEGSAMFAPRLVLDAVLDVATPSGLPGDYNNDGSVDAADYAMWRDNEGSGTPLLNDDGLGTPIAAAHFSLWRQHFGDTVGSGSGQSSSVPVPEPASSMLFCLATIGLVGSCRYHRRTVRP